MKTFTRSTSIPGSLILICSAAAFFQLLLSLYYIYCGLHKRQKSFPTSKLFRSESTETCVDIAPPDLKSDLGLKSGFMNLVVKFMAALKNDTD